VQVAAAVMLPCWRARRNWWRATATVRPRLRSRAKYYDTVVTGRVPLSQNSVVFSLNDKKTGVKATGKATIETSLLKVVGLEEIDVFSSSASERWKRITRPAIPAATLKCPSCST
jgi:hypothetical protein